MVGELSTHSIEWSGRLLPVMKLDVKRKFGKREGTRPASQPASQPASHARGDVERGL